jgi:hypothetical protein
VGGAAAALCGHTARVLFEVRFMVWLKTALVLRLLWYWFLVQPISGDCESSFWPPSTWKVVWCSSEAAGFYW